MSCSCSCGAIMREGEGRSEGVRKCLLTTVKEDYILLGQKPPLNCLKHKSFVKTFVIICWLECSMLNTCEIHKV